ncbi:MAG: LCP family protein [Lachnospiraceae bacterium]|nr:LCP family protein [Lachnospiraceae bacterium]
MSTKVRGAEGNGKKKKKLTKAAKRKRRLKRILAFEFVLMFLLLVMGVGVKYVLDKWGLIDTKDIDEDALAISENINKESSGYTNIALFGVDARDASVIDTSNSDCIIILSINNKTKEIKMVSVYRDTLLMCPDKKDSKKDYDLRKANYAYSAGGPQLAIAQLNKNLDLDITDYAAVNWNALATAVDEVGGLEIEISKAEMEEINRHIVGTADSTGKKCNLVEEYGLVHMDGNQVTTYCRIRKGGTGNDFARAERQRQVISLLVQKAQTMNLKTLNSIIDEVFPMISTSVSLSEVLGLAKDATKYSIGETKSFPFQFTTATLGKKGDCIIPCGLSYNVSALHEFLFGTENYEPSAKVEELDDAIYNYTGVPTYVEPDEAS